MKDSTRKDLATIASVASVGASYAALAIALLNKKPLGSKDEKLIRETPDKEWAFYEPELVPPNDIDAVAIMGYTCGWYDMWSFLYKDGHMTHAWTSYEDHHEDEIPQEVIEIAKEELVRFAKANGLKCNSKAKKHKFWPF